MGNFAEMLTTLLELTAEGILIEDADRLVVQSSPAFEALTGLTAEDVQGRTIESLLAESSAQDTLDAMRQGLRESGGWSGRLTLRCKDGAPRAFEVRLKTIPVSNDALPQHIASFKPCEEVPLADPGALSQLDALTGLPSRYLLKDRLEQALIAAQRAKRSVAVLSLGVDHLARINDGLGYEVGDHVLKEVGRRLEAAVRQSDTVARLTGDQFLLVMQVTAQNDTVIVAEKLLKTMNRPLTIEGQQLSVTASIGISIFPTDCVDQDSLLNGSASAMRHAKRVGRHCYQFFSSEMNQRAKQRIELESNIRKALENKEFLVYYQPKVNIETDRIVGAEALLRWNHPVRGMIPPGEFIPVAEESGLIDPLGEWVLRQVCVDNSRWLSQGLAVVPISVNVAAPQFRAHDIVDKVRAILTDTGLPSQYLELEITENMLMQDTERTIKKLLALRDLGLQVAIDDFGTGYSSLSYLAKFPITTLKIDRAFIRDIDEVQSTAEITRAIIGLSRGLELDIVAEGAETAGHIAFLRQHGCSTVQGFYYSRPVPTEAFERLLRKGCIEHG